LSQKIRICRGAGKEKEIFPYYVNEPASQGGKRKKGKKEAGGKKRRVRFVSAPDKKKGRR